MEHINLQNKRVGIVGLSVEGLITLDYLQKSKAHITVYDQRDINNLPESVRDAINKNNIKGSFGPDYLSGIEENELIVRTPGMPLWDFQIQSAIKKGVTVTSHTKLFFTQCPCPIIGVTGTKGKGTTASLIYEILKHSGKDVYLGGNIGTPPLSFIDKLNRDSWAVLELSSFQLEDLDKSPHIGVVLNITSDHLASQSKESPNYHRAHTDYLKSKQNILLHQNKNDFALLNYDSNTTKNLDKITKGEVWYFSNRSELAKGSFVKNGFIVIKDGSNTHTVCKTDKVSLLGKHNLENITAAITTGYILKVSLDTIQKTVSLFKGLEHRLEFVREISGVAYYNDSFSTVPETAIAAIQSFSNPIILIAGGSEKNSDYKKLGEEIITSPVKAVILIGETGPQIKKAIVNAGYKTDKKLPTIIEGSGSMKEIIHKTNSLSEKDDIVLLSPASASFGLFKNYKERGKLFKDYVTKL